MAYEKEIEKQIAKHGGLTEAAHQAALKKQENKNKAVASTMKQKENWAQRLKRKVKAHFSEEKAKKKLAEDLRKMRLERKRKQDEAIIARARKRGARI